MGANLSVVTLDPFLIDYIARFLSDSGLLIARSCCKRLRRRLCPLSVYTCPSLNNTGSRYCRETLLCEFNSCALFKPIFEPAYSAADYLILLWDNPDPQYCIITEYRSRKGIISRSITSFRQEEDSSRSQVEAYGQYALDAIFNDGLQILWLLKRWHKDEVIINALLTLQGEALPPESSAMCYEWYPHPVCKTPYSFFADVSSHKLK